MAKVKRRHYLNGTYNNMIRRCYVKEDASYHNYGGRGIKVCDRWLPNQPDAQGFWNFINDMGPKPTNFTLDRLDNHGDYTFENCHWKPHSEQALNRRDNIRITYNGKTQTAVEWARELKINKGTLLYRYHKGLPTALVLCPKNYRGKSL